MTRQALLLPPSPLFKLLSKWSTAVPTRCCHPFQRTGNYQIPKFLKHSKCRLPLRVCGLLFAVGSLTLPCVHYAYISIDLDASSSKITSGNLICWAHFCSLYFRGKSASFAVFAWSKLLMIMALILWSMFGISWIHLQGYRVYINSLANWSSTYKWTVLIMAPINLL